jgi:VanZ family protein
MNPAEFLIRNRRLNLALTVLWMAFIFIVSGIEGSRLEGGFSGWAPLFHIMEYMVLAFLLYTLSLSSEAALLASIFYALADEFHQAFVPGRTASMIDVGYDTIGAALGIMLARRLRGRR